MIRRIQDWMFRQALIERSERHRMGYAWALSELHRGLDPADAPHQDDCNLYFYLGVADACYDWNNSISADAMWDKANEDLEKTQPLPRLELTL